MEQLSSCRDAAGSWTHCFCLVHDKALRYWHQGYMQLETPVDLKHARFKVNGSQAATAAGGNTMSYDDFMAYSSHMSTRGNPKTLLIYVPPAEDQPEGQWLPAAAALQRLGLTVMQEAEVAPKAPAKASGTPSSAMFGMSAMATAGSVTGCMCLQVDARAGPTATRSSAADLCAPAPALLLRLLQAGRH